MNTSLTLPTLALVCALATGCVAPGALATEPAAVAAAPASSSAAPSDCTSIAKAEREAEAAHRAAVEAKETAWKGVVPFAVAARYAGAAKAASETERKQAELKAAGQRLGCPHAG